MTLDGKLVLITGARMPELTQFDRTKSMMRNLPPNGVAGLQQILIGHTSGPSLGVSVAVTAVFGLAMLGAGTVLASRRVQD